LLKRPENLGMLSKLSELEIGRAAELLVCADLTLQGYPAFIAGAQLPYDVVVEAEGRMLRVQVKASRGLQNIAQRATHTPRYQFWVKRCGKGGARNYLPTDFDLIALVALDIRVVAYMPNAMARQTMHLRPPGCAGTKWARRQECIEDYPFAGALEALAR